MLDLNLLSYLEAFQGVLFFYQRRTFWSFLASDLGKTRQSFFRTQGVVRFDEEVKGGPVEVMTLFSRPLRPLFMHEKRLSQSSVNCRFISRPTFGRSIVLCVLHANVLGFEDP